MISILCMSGQFRQMVTKFLYALTNIRWYCCHPCVCACTLYMRQRARLHIAYNCYVMIESYVLYVHVHLFV